MKGDAMKTEAEIRHVIELHWKAVAHNLCPNRFGTFMAVIAALEWVTGVPTMGEGGPSNPIPATIPLLEEMTADLDLPPTAKPR
jgi:hypothetical protein